MVGFDAMQTLAKAHRPPPPLPSQVLENREMGVVVRYDGFSSGNESHVYGVFALNDLAKLDPSHLEQLDFADARRAFFREGEAGTQLYVDLDAYTDFVADVIADASARGLPVADVTGDLNVMTVDTGELAPPAKAAFMLNGTTHVPSRVGLDEVEIARRGYESRGPSYEAPDGPEPF